MSKFENPNPASISVNFESYYFQNANARPDRKGSLNKSSSFMCRRKAASIIRNTDIFGHEVKITYKGDSQFKTLFGGIMSIICMALVLAYLAAEFNRVTDYTINIEQNTLYYDKVNGKTGYALAASENDLILEISSYIDNVNILQFLKISAFVEPLTYAGDEG